MVRYNSLYLLLTLLAILKFVAGQDPTCSNPTVTPSRNTWALNYTGQLYSVYFCIPTPGQANDLVWIFEDSLVVTLASFRFDSSFGSNPCQPAAPVAGYTATCQYNNTGMPAGILGCYTTTFSITNKLTSSFNQSTLTLSHVDNCLRNTFDLQDCNPVNNSSLITSASSSPCGYQCQVEYSCAPNYSGDNVSAVCLADATFSATPNCGLIVCSNSALCSTTIPRYCYNKTGSTNAGANVTTQCKTGYSGSVSATCGNDGNWTITTQSPCPALCPVSDITSSPGRCTTATGDILEGQSITVTCCNGYAGVSTMAVCTSDRSWSNLPTCTKTDSSLTTGIIIGIVIGCLIAVAIIIFFLIPICCAEICCCTFSILCLSWGTKN